MGKRTKHDPTGQAGNRKRATSKLQARFTTAERQTKALFRQIPRTRRRRVTLQNSLRGNLSIEHLLQGIRTSYKMGRDPVPLIQNATIPVYDYQITPEELEALGQNIRNIVDDVVLQTRNDRMPPNWWWQDVIESPYRQGTAEEIRDFNQLVTEELVRVRAARGVPTMRLEVGAVLQSQEYQQALNNVYVRNFNNIKTLSDRTADQVVQTINAGMQAGMTPTEISKMISERYDVSRSGAQRTADTEVNKAYNDARLNATDVAAKVTGLRAGVLHLSALIPTTRTGHAARHGNAYTTDQQRQWWEEGANRINCHCSTRSVLIDAQGNVIDLELQEEIQAERTFFDEVEGGGTPPAPPAPRKRRTRKPPAPPAPPTEFTDKQVFREQMMRQFGGDFEIRTNASGNKIAPQVMTTFAKLATEYNNARPTVRHFSISNTAADGKRVRIQERGHVARYSQSGDKDYFIHSGKPKGTRYKSTLQTVQPGDEIEATVTHEFAHLMFITTERNAPMAAAVEEFRNGQLYARYTGLKNRYTRGRQSAAAKHNREVSAEFRDGKFANIDAANDELARRIEQDMLEFLAQDADGELFVSEYAFTSLDETLAEGFAAYKLTDKPSPVAAEIGRLFDEYFKRE